MKKIISNSKMREVLRIPPDERGARTAVFEKWKEDKKNYTELSDSDFRFLKDQEGGPFSFYLDEGVFILVDDNIDDAPKSKIDIEIDKLLAEKEKKESTGKKFKSEATLKKLIAQRDAQGN